MHTQVCPSVSETFLSSTLKNIFESFMLSKFLNISSPWVTKLNEKELLKETLIISHSCTHVDLL